MAAITSAANGNWSATGTWTGSVVPAEGDTVIINHAVVIDDNCAEPLVIGADNATAAISVASGKSLKVLKNIAEGTAPTVNHTIILKANMTITGTFECGTVVQPIPSTRTVIIQTNYSASLADGKYGILVAAGGTCTIQGASVTDRCKLNTDEAAAQTVLGVDTNTGWVSGQLIGIASTSRTYSECEQRTVESSNATTVTVIAGLTNAHSGTSPTQAEVIMLTRNVKITAYDTTAVGYISFATTATVDIDYVEFSYLGENATGKRGLEVNTTTGSCNIQNCSLHDFEDRGVFTSSATFNNLTFSNNVCYNLASLVANCITIGATSGTSITFDNNIVMLAAAATNSGFNLTDVGGVFTNNTICGINGYGIQLNQAAALGTLSGGEIHSNANLGIYFAAYYTTGTISSMSIWRNGSSGTASLSTNLTDITMFGNTTINIAGISPYSIITITNLVSNGDSTFATTNGINLSNNVNLVLVNCNFSTISGIKTAHTNDLNLGSSLYLCMVTGDNVKLLGTNPVGTPTNLGSGSYIKIQGLAAGSHKSWFPYGIIETDSTVYNTAAPSQKLTPNSASYKLESGSKLFAVASGSTATVSVYVRQSEAAEGDSADYNGAKPRLVLKRNYAAGILADTVLDTMAGGIGNPWEQLSGVTTPAVTDNAVLEVVVDCDGTAGFINVDDWAVS